MHHRVFPVGLRHLHRVWSCECTANTVSVFDRGIMLPGHSKFPFSESASPVVLSGTSVLFSTNLLQISTVDHRVCNEPVFLPVSSSEGWHLELPSQGKALKYPVYYSKFGPTCYLSENVTDMLIWRSIANFTHLFNHLKMKRKLLYLKTQFVPRSKYFSYQS